MNVTCVPSFERPERPERPGRPGRPGHPVLPDFPNFPERPEREFGIAAFISILFRRHKPYSALLLV